MKTKFPIILAIGVAGLILTTTSGFAQGSLTPPGPPAPTMLTLTQVEPRTPVDSAHLGPPGGSAEYLITVPGSYYLTSNVLAEASLHGINISASDVTLDLRGFSVLGSSSGYDGIYIHAGFTNIAVCNGNISGWINTSVYANGVESYANNVVLERLNVSGNYQNGIYFAGSGVVRDCNVQNNGNDGIYAAVNCAVTGCTAIGNNSTFIPSPSNGGIAVGFECTVTGCIAENNRGSNGIYAGTLCTVKDCITSLNLNGINVVNGCTVSGCTANTNVTFGIVASNGNQISGNTASGNGTYGISLAGAQNRVDNNYVGGNLAYGISVQTVNVDNNITRNFAPGNGFGGYFNYTGNNDYAPLQTPPSTATSPWANSQ